MRVLAVDTAGPVVGVALAVDGEVVVRTERVKRGAEALLVPWAVALAGECGVALSELDGVGVAVGPGAFTGVRVGISTAVGLAFAAGCPVWQGCSLDHRAAAVADERVLAMLDARKSRVYASLYERGQVVRGPLDVPPQEAVAWAQGPFAATGAGSAVYASLVSEAGGRVVDEPEDPGVHLLALRAVAGLTRGQGVPPHRVEPVYLRDADAKPPRDLLR